MLKKLTFLMTFLFFMSGIAYAGTVDLPKTGQTTSFATGDDGDLKIGVAWPPQRFTDNLDGTVTDNLTGLIWLQDANCFGTRLWFDALSDANTLADGQCGLTDSSVAGDWRLPNVNELESLVNAEESDTAAWLNDPAQGFTNVQSYAYWSSTTGAASLGVGYAWGVGMGDGAASYSPKVISYNYVWSVRATTTLPAQIWKTGQTNCYDSSGAIVPCAGTGQDGDIQAGVAWPSPTRFTDNTDGTVTDNLTGLIWLKNANCFGTRLWSDTLSDANTLADGQCGLSDSSNAGNWRLPNRKEFHSLTDFSQFAPSLPSGHPFTNVQSGYYSVSYWSSTTWASNTSLAWFVSMWGDGVHYSSKTNYKYVWPVRSTTATPTCDLVDDLVGYYPFINGDTTDQSGLGNDGTIMGSGVTKESDRFGNADNAYRFDGTDNAYINLGNDVSLKPTDAITLSAWIKPDGVFSYYGAGYIMSDGRDCCTNTGGVGLRLFQTGQRPLGMSWDPQTQFPYNDPTIYNIHSPVVQHAQWGISLDQENAWHHIVYTFDGSSTKMYQKGSLVAMKALPVPTTIKRSPYNLMIGALNVWGNDYVHYNFHGVIDDVRIYNCALSDSDIQGLYDINLPTLTYSTESGYDDGVDTGGDRSVEPNSGDTTTLFTFKVVYTDPDGYAPNSLKIYIDGDTTGVDITSFLDTSASDPTLYNGAYTDGEQYYFDVPSLPVGTHFYYFEASDEANLISLPASGTDAGPTVTGNSTDTPAGSSVVVTPIEGVVITYTGVNPPGGSTTVVEYTGPTCPPQPPITDGFKMGDPSVCYSISTNVSYTSPITVCINYDPSQFSNENNIALLHGELNDWFDRTTSLDTLHNIVCGEVNNFSEFVVAEGGGEDFGDAPDPSYPSLQASVGAMHTDFSREWLGDSVDGEGDSEQVNADLFDDGIVFNGTMDPGVPVVLNVKVNTSGEAGRYVSGSASERLYLHAWFDWNGDGDWDDTDEYAVYWAGGPAFDDDTTQPSAITTWNSSGAWPGYPNGKILSFTVTPPAGMTESPFYSRFRLDYGEDIATVTGAASYGEVEDYKHEIYTLITLVSFTATEVDDGVLLEWETASEIDNAGFNIWRKEGKNGEYIKNNDTLIPAEGNPTSGAYYSLNDDTVVSGTIYYYRLEDIDTNGVSTFYDETVSVALGLLSGSESKTGSAKGKGCFIATAAYGSYLDPHVSILREFRDGYLLTNRAGQGFVDLYYRYSPPMADFIAEHGFLRAVTRVLLLPLIGFGAFMVKTTLVQKMLVMIVFLALLTGGWVTMRRRRLEDR